MSVDPKKFGITPSLVDAVKLTLEGKSLAALAPPRDKVTHKDVLVGRGVLKKHPQDPDKHVVAKEEAEQVDEGSRVKAVGGSRAAKVGNAMDPKDRIIPKHGTKAYADWIAKNHAGRKFTYSKPHDDNPASTKNEEVEQVDELSRKTLASYVKKAGGTSLDSAAALALDGNRKKAKLRAKSVERAADRLAKEEVEQVDELSKGTLGSYVKKASGRVADKSRHAGDIENRRDISPAAKEVLAKQNRKIDNSLKGISRATDRLTKEDVEQVDELSKGTLGSYVNKAAGSAATHTGAAAAYGSSSKNPNAAKMAQHQAIATKRTAGIQKAVGKLTKEDAEHVAEADVKNAGPKVKDEYKNFHDKFKSHSKENQAKITSNLRKGMSYKDAIKNVSEADGSSNPSTSSSALDKINSIATDMKKMASEPLKPPKDPGADKKLPHVNAPGAPSMFKTEAVADPMAAKKAEVQKKIAQKQATAVQARANKRMSNINASNDKCSCGSTNESKMKCEVHGDSGMKGGKEKIEVNPPLREAEDLPKKVITKGHEIAKSLIKHRAKVREPYAVGMAQAKKSAGIKN